MRCGAVGLGRWYCGALIAVIALGCGRPNRVTGTVTFDGKPLPAGRVAFQCDGKGKPVISSEIEENGTYEIVDPPVGRARVAVQTFKPDSLPPEQVTGPYVPIPLRFGLPKTSGLEYTIKPGEQTFDIRLSK